MIRRTPALLVLSFVATLVAATAIQAGVVVSDGTTSEEVVLEITIRHSGLLSRKTTVIRYRQSDRAIVEVRENGEKVSSEKLEQYRQLLGDALEVSELQNLIPELDAVNRTFESAEVSDSEKLRELDGLLRKLDGLESEFAMTQRGLAQMRQQFIKFEAAIDGMEKELARSGINLTEENEVEIRDRRVFVDGEPLSREISDRCIAIFEEITGDKVESGRTTLKWRND